MNTPDKWAGDRERQEQLVIWFIGNTGHESAVDIVGACETILSNLTARAAYDIADAERMIDGIAEDMKQTVREKFAQEVKQ